MTQLTSPESMGLIPFNTQTTQTLSGPVQTGTFLQPGVVNPGDLPVKVIEYLRQRYPGPYLGTSLGSVWSTQDPRIIEAIRAVGEPAPTYAQGTVGGTLVTQVLSGQVPTGGVQTGGATATSTGTNITDVIARLLPHIQGSLAGEQIINDLDSGRVDERTALSQIFQNFPQLANADVIFGGVGTTADQRPRGGGDQPEFNVDNLPAGGGGGQAQEQDPLDALNEFLEGGAGPDGGGAPPVGGMEAPDWWPEQAIPWASLTSTDRFTRVSKFDYNTFNSILKAVQSGAFGAQAQAAAVAYGARNAGQIFSQDVNGDGRPEQFIRQPDGSIQPFQPQTQSLDDQINEALATGDIDMAVALTNFRDRPSDLDRAKAALEFARSPADIFTISNIARGNIGLPSVQAALDPIQALRQVSSSDFARAAPGNLDTLERGLQDFLGSGGGTNAIPFLEQTGFSPEQIEQFRQLTQPQLVRLGPQTQAVQDTFASLFQDPVEQLRQLILSRQQQPGPDILGGGSFDRELAEGTAEAPFGVGGAAGGEATGTPGNILGGGSFGRELAEGPDPLAGTTTIDLNNGQGPFPATAQQLEFLQRTGTPFTVVNRAVFQQPTSGAQQLVKGSPTGGFQDLIADRTSLQAGFQQPGTSLVKSQPDPRLQNLIADRRSPLTGFQQPSAGFPQAPAGFRPPSTSGLQLPAGISQLLSGSPLGAPINLLAAAGIRPPSAESLRRLLPSEQSVLFELGQLAGIPQEDFMHQLRSATLAGGTPSIRRTPIRRV